MAHLAGICDSARTRTLRYLLDDVLLLMGPLGGGLIVVYRLAFELLLSADALGGPDALGVPPPRGEIDPETVADGASLVEAGGLEASPVVETVFDFAREGPIADLVGEPLGVGTVRPGILVLTTTGVPLAPAPRPRRAGDWNRGAVVAAVAGASEGGFGVPSGAARGDFGRPGDLEGDCEALAVRLGCDVEVLGMLGARPRGLR